jgi:hypothetical protein
MMLSRSNMARVHQPHKRMVSPSGKAALISPPSQPGRQFESGGAGHLIPPIEAFDVGV